MKEFLYELCKDLKPCPFCGARPRIEYRSRCFIGGESTKASYVRCPECEARTGKFADALGTRTATEMAVEAWQRREETERCTGE